MIPIYRTISIENNNLCVFHIDKVSMDGNLDELNYIKSNAYDHFLKGYYSENALIYANQNGHIDILNFFYHLAKNDVNFQLKIPSYALFTPNHLVNKFFIYMILHEKWNTKLIMKSHFFISMDDDQINRLYRMERILFKMVGDIIENETYENIFIDTHSYELSDDVLISELNNEIHNEHQYDPTFEKIRCFALEQSELTPSMKIILIDTNMFVALNIHKFEFYLSIGYDNLCKLIDYHLENSKYLPVDKLSKKRLISFLEFNQEELIPRGIKINFTILFFLLMRLYFDKSQNELDEDADRIIKLSLGFYTAEEYNQSVLIRKHYDINFSPEEVLEFVIKFGLPFELDYEWMIYSGDESNTSVLNVVNGILDNEKTRDLLINLKELCRICCETNKKNHYINDINEIYTCDCIYKGLIRTVQSIYYWCFLKKEFDVLKKIYQLVPPPDVKSLFFFCISCENCNQLMDKFFDEIINSTQWPELKYELNNSSQDNDIFEKRQIILTSFFLNEVDFMKQYSTYSAYLSQPLILSHFGLHALTYIIALYQHDTTPNKETFRAFLQLYSEGKIFFNDSLRAKHPDVDEQDLFCALFIIMSIESTNLCETILDDYQIKLKMTPDITIRILNNLNFHNRAKFIKRFNHIHNPSEGKDSIHNLFFRNGINFMITLDSLKNFYMYCSKDELSLCYDLINNFYCGKSNDSIGDYIRPDPNELCIVLFDSMFTFIIELFEQGKVLLNLSIIMDGKLKQFFELENENEQKKNAKSCFNTIHYFLTDSVNFSNIFLQNILLILNTYDKMCEFNLIDSSSNPLWVLRKYYDQLKVKEIKIFMDKIDVLLV
jgi:hypothetical protein